MDALLLRFDAPLMSFGAVVVDQHHPTWRFPGAAMLTGLLGNALGWDHSDTVRLQALQDRLHFAARWDVEPELLIDYQTVDLGQSFLEGTGWTTRGRREDRGKGDATSATHIRFRHYWANGVATIALTLEGREPPSLEELEAALRHPARPLFLGRKPCLPAAPLLLGRRSAESLKGALAAEPLAAVGPRRSFGQRLPALWPLEEGEAAGTEERYDVRDWANNIHRGVRRYAVGWLEVST
ncbi:MAG: type I-E CRISPR-associated protein Cas5/CasD [Casimicrobiaceae bacterium]|nr:type I-E CRISPR-associated protein Cas5/CasD [Casimicrobiaceae bacterium]MCX8098520.1 type I-E CRISPR-associated protein Cas5/CasD [Casimicrobiaceae bacterium]MDW8312123.1 type I-E CRISPR-associated protein Cas5/CasD [Burkholderiales bacterium]